jgi:hypothetical protein
MSNYGINDDNFSSDYKKYCGDFRYLAAAYLILYNPFNKEASIATIYYSSPGDGGVNCRYFFIDKDYNIFLFDFSVTDDENTTSGGYFPGKKYIISILKNGAVSVTENKK